MLLVAPLLLVLLLLSPSCSAQLAVGHLYGFETPAATAGSYSSSFKSPDSKAKSYTPFAFSAWAGISIGSDFLNSDQTFYQGSQFGFLQAGYLNSGSPGNLPVSIPSSTVQTRLSGLAQGHYYNVSFAYSNRNPAYANDNGAEPSGPDSGNVHNLTLQILIGMRPIFTKTLNADTRTFIPAFTTFEYTGQPLLTFSGAAAYGDQTILIDAIQVTAI